MSKQTWTPRTVWSSLIESTVETRPCRFRRSPTMRIDNDPKLDFDDVLIRPKRSEAPSRATIVLQRAYRFLNSGAAWKGIPIVASNMDTVGTVAMAEALGPEMMTCLHKYYPEARLIEYFGDDSHRATTFFTLGIKDDEFDRLLAVRAKA